MCYLRLINVFYRVVPKRDVISTGENTVYGISANRKRYEETTQPSMLVSQQ